MEKVYISSIIYKNIVFDIYNINGKLTAFTNEENVDFSVIEKVNQSLYDDSKILKSSNNFIKPLVGAVVLASSLNFLGTYSISDLESINDKIIYENVIDLDELSIKFKESLSENKNLTNEEKKLFEKQFNYMKDSYKYSSNTDFMLNIIKNIKIDKNEDENPIMIGCFNIENSQPTITLYKNATEETLIHEIYHALKYGEYYYEKPYLYNEKFIDAEIYNKLKKEEQIKCIQFDLKGSFLEEADTSLRTTATEEVNNLHHDYRDEVYIYKVYEQIFGKELMEKNILNSNKIVLFLNSIIDLGYDAREAAAIGTRLDLLETFKQNPIEDMDYASIKYQICDDLANVYQKKYGNLDSKLLQLSTLAVINNENIKSIQKFENNYVMKEYYVEIMNGTISAKSILEQLGYSFDDKYGINGIDFDYFTDDNILIYITIDTNHVIVLSLDDNNNLKFVEEKTEKEPYEYKLYNDYYEFAMQTYNNERYACFFAACYSNIHITENERVLIMREFEKTTGDLDTDDFKNLLLFGNYKKIMNGLENYYFAEKFKQK